MASERLVRWIWAGWDDPAAGREPSDEDVWVRARGELGGRVCECTLVSDLELRFMKLHRAPNVLGIQAWPALPDPVFPYPGLADNAAVVRLLDLSGVWVVSTAVRAPTYMVVNGVGVFISWRDIPLAFWKDVFVFYTLC